MGIIYVDNNATTRVAPEVCQAMAPYFSENYFNPSSMYEPARRTADALARARADLAAFLGAVPDEILFTSCATESNNAALFGAVKANPQRRHVITTTVEHPAVLEVCKDLQRSGCEVTFLPVDRDGNLDLRQYIRALRPDTLLVSVMHANNETGVVFPVAQLARLAKETDPAIVFHTDATQSVGKLPIALDGEFSNVDLLSFSGHKLHAPKGVGALFVRRGTPVKPLLIGGHQEQSRRAGTENVPYCVGLARAVVLAADDHAAVDARIRRLRDRLEQAIRAMIPCVQVNGEGAVRLSNTLNVSCQAIEGESILKMLDSDGGICASSGSACTTGSLEPSHVLKAMNIPFTGIHGSVRFSFSRYNTEADVDRIIEVFPQVVSRLRAISPFWDAARNRPKDDLHGDAAGTPLRAE
jgi:cysteine desulfurase